MTSSQLFLVYLQLPVKIYCLSDFRKITEKTIESFVNVPIYLTISKYSLLIIASQNMTIDQVDRIHAL